MAIGIGVVALLIGAFVGTKKSTGPELERFWKKEDAPVVAEFYVPIGAADVLHEQINKECKARGDAAGRNKSADVSIRQAAAYVSCLANEKPKRLCQLTHRTHLLAALRNYYRLQAKMRERRVNSDPQVVEALKAVITNGYMPRRDIVAAIEQSDLDAVLRGVEAKKGGC